VRTPATVTTGASPRLADAPAFSLADAERIARECYGHEGSATALASERDQNFLVVRRDGSRIVLKIANAGEDPAMLAAQQAVMAHLTAHSERTPRVVPTAVGDTTCTVTGPDGRKHLAWAVTYLPGVVLANACRRSSELLRDFGTAIGELRRGLDGFDHPAIHREFYWDLAQARRVIADYRPLIDDAGLGATIDSVMERFDRRIAPGLVSLRRAAIHNDLNDHNVLVGDGAHAAPGHGLDTGARGVLADDPWSRHQRITGIVDFGDMVHSYAIGDLAIAAAYVALDAPDPLTAMSSLVRGYHAISALEENELAALPGLILLRLCASACIAAEQRRQRPDNDYLDVSQAAIRRTLPALAAIPFGLAEAAFRDACGLEPSRSSARVRAWLQRNASSFASVLDADLRRERCTVLDLSIGSPMISGDERENAEPLLTKRVFGAMAADGTRVGVGRYDEPRLLYTSSFFAAGGDLLEERRTIHIGLDLFADAGTPIYAPIAGTVHAFADNHAPLDYGPLIILRHETDDGTEFFTLYGHLSRESLHGLTLGKPIPRGARIATMGTPDVNVGWTPHLHLQLITDLLELGTDYPGVARASQRALWRSLSPDPNLVVGIPADRFPRLAPGKASALAERRTLLGRNLSVAYRDPVRIARGWMQYLFDDEGRRYLDAYNNVPHVGHAHPRVVRAGADQMAVLSTNTRYLSDIVNEYAERLTATFPAPLRVCYLLNSASEANELALRLARATTQRRDMIVLEAAYHGNTTSLIDLSPYKHAGPGGSGAPDWVHVAPLPDDYRGPHTRHDFEAGTKYAAAIATIIARQDAAGRSIAGFIAESCPSVGGQIMLPPGYLAAAYAGVRAAGGVCIADEVQTGLGRIGTHFWAFESQGVVPDIVVLGKPLGNGHPLAAVVTTPEIAAAFDNGMEFFSTFGGNTVSCAVGLAVLDVMRDDGLQAHALRVGERMLRSLGALMTRHAVIGDVRGSGLFIGVELVRDRATLEPAAAEASYVVERMRELGILLGTDGPHHNVVKIRPPMPFTDTDADLLVESLDRVLAELS
jgi:4-aminobutyrate aminotransferase-like enzyme/Ser/Thr protein kinase RdoA (MazF antagonist)